MTRSGRLMLAGLAATTLVLLLTRRWELAGAMLALSCIGSCGAAWWMGERSSRAIARESARLREARRAR